ncbi:DNA adenine methylase [Roseomonas sp. F4]
MESSLLPAPAAVPVAPWVGGKRNLAKHIIPRLEALPHLTYAEPFIGMGGVFLRRRRRPRAEVINDISGDVVTLFRVLQRHPAALMDCLRWQLASRQDFGRLRATDPTTLTDIERAARFISLQRMAYGGLLDGVFRVAPGAPGKLNPAKLEPLLHAAHARLAEVTIEQLAYADFIRRYDRPGTLFYLDPPYFRCETYYGNGIFAPSDFDHLAELLAGLQGRFLMSINDAPEVRKIFGRFKIEEVAVHYPVAGGAQKPRVHELLISGRR